MKKRINSRKNKQKRDGCSVAGISLFSGAGEVTSLNVCGSMATAYANPPQKTHEITFDPREVRYPWHRWFGRIIETRKAGGLHYQLAYLCKLPESPPHTMLVEVPKWMFDAAECASMRIEALPHVDCERLRVLKRVIVEQRSSLRAAVIKPQPTGESGSGGTDVRAAHGKTEKTVSAVQRTTHHATLGRSRPTDKSRSSKPAGSVARQHPDRRSNSRSSRTRRTR